MVAERQKVSYHSTHSKFIYSLQMLRADIEWCHQQTKSYIIMHGI